MNIAENIKKIKEKIGNKNIILVAVTKNVDIEKIKEAYALGIRNFGENRIQEAIPKIEALKDYNDIIWHFVGHLQSNKAKHAVKYFQLIQSIDKITTLQVVNKYAEKINKIQQVLIEVNTSLEETKYGLKMEEVFEFINDAKSFKNIQLKGLMTIGPLTTDRNKISESFQKLKNLNEELKNQFPEIQFEYLSMGMSDDYEIAIEEGANMLRIGRAIFC